MPSKTDSVQSVIASRPKRSSTYQSKLFSLPITTKRANQDDKRAFAKKKSKRDDKATKVGEEDEEEKEVGNVATTTDSSKLLQVTREAFLDQYRVEGLKDIYYQEDWIDAKTAHRWHNELKAMPQWYRPKLKVYGKEIQQSRAIAAFATVPGLDLKYSGHQVEMHAPFPLLLEQIASRLSTETCLGSDVKFNHAMLNSYENGQVYIGKHSDNLENKVIVTVSLGAPRTWIMQEKKPRGSTEVGNRYKWILENGSLLVMQGDVQKRYTHEIPKEAKVKESRISITFRQLVY